MRNFYTKNTIEAPNWCKKCGRETQWRIEGGRPMYCNVCYSKTLKEVSEPKPDTQGRLFQ